MVARRGKCPKNHFFCIFGLLSYKYNLHQVGLEFRQLFDILVHPNEHGYGGDEDNENRCEGEKTPYFISEITKEEKSAKN